MGWLRGRGFDVASRLILGVVLAGIVALPFALERGLERAVVHDSIGVVPATFTLTGTAHTQLSLGILGSLRLPLSRGPIGVHVTIDGPPPLSVSGKDDLASYFSPQMLQVYGGLFHDPGPAIRGYIEELRSDYLHEVAVADLIFAVPVGLLGASLTWLLDPKLLRLLHRHRVRAYAFGITGALVLSSAAALWEFHEWPGRHHDPISTFSLPSLDGTPMAGATTDSLVLRVALEDGLAKVQKLIDRQELRTSQFASQSMAALERDLTEMTGPRENEVAIMMQSDMHCNSAMIAFQKKVVELLDDKYGDGTISVLAISGDLTTNGTAAEGACIKDEAEISNGAPVVAVTGNHETATSAKQMKGVGMEVLQGDTEEVAGTTFLGAGDPSRSEMFGATSLRDPDVTEESVGKATYETAVKDQPEIVMLHEGYAVAPFLGLENVGMQDFLENRGSRTAPWNDGVRDVPASAVFYGHWHRSVEPRVVWNSDGTWTLVMELNTSGGAIATPTLNHFSTPWSKPQQLASFPVIFKDTDTGLITGYQLYSVTPKGEVEVHPRVEVGIPVETQSSADTGESGDTGGSGAQARDTESKPAVAH